MTDPIPLKTEKNASPAAALQCKNMIAIASGKGGVGKTWFSITLCHALAKQGKHVLLFDGDLGLANVDIQLGLTPDKDLGSVVDGTSTLPAAVTKYAEGGFDLLAGRSGSGSLANLSTQKVSELRNDLIALARNYDYVFVDLGAGVDRLVLQLAGPAAISYAVMTDEPPSLIDAYTYILKSRAANPNADVRVIVNMAANMAEGQKAYEALRKTSESFLQYVPPLAGIIRRDTKVRDAIRAQTPLLTRYPSTDAAQDIENIAAKLIAG